MSAFSESVAVPPRLGAPVVPVAADTAGLLALDPVVVAAGDAFVVAPPEVVLAESAPHAARSDPAAVAASATAAERYIKRRREIPERVGNAAVNSESSRTTVLLRAGHITPAIHHDHYLSTCKTQGKRIGAWEAKNHAPHHPLHPRSRTAPIR